MENKRALKTKVLYQRTTATIISRCFAGGEWLYGLRLKSGRLVDYIPASMLRDVPAE